MSKMWRGGSAAGTARSLSTQDAVSDVSDLFSRLSVRSARKVTSQDASAPRARKVRTNKHKDFGRKLAKQQRVLARDAASYDDLSGSARPRPMLQSRGCVSTVISVLTMLFFLSTCGHGGVEASFGNVTIYEHYIEDDEFITINCGSAGFDVPDFNWGFSYVPLIALLCAFAPLFYWCVWRIVKDVVVRATFPRVDSVNLQAGGVEVFVALFTLMFSEVRPTDHYRRIKSDPIFDHLPFRDLRDKLYKARLWCNRTLGIPLTHLCAYAAAVVVLSTTKKGSRMWRVADAVAGMVERFIMIRVATWVVCKATGAIDPVSEEYARRPGPSEDQYYARNHFMNREPHDGAAPPRPSGVHPDAPDLQEFADLIFEREVIVPQLPVADDSVADAQFGEDILASASGLIAGLSSSEAQKSIMTTVRLVAVLMTLYLGLSSGTPARQVLEKTAEVPGVKAFAGGVGILSDIISFVSKLTDAYSAGSIYTFFGYDARLSALEKRMGWMDSLDFKEVTKGVPSFEADRLIYMHELLREGRLLCDDIEAYIKAKVGSGNCSPPLRKRLEAKVSLLKARLCELAALNEGLGLHTKPFAVLIPGPSCIGKTTLYTILFRTVCEALDIPYGAEYVYTINDLQKHWDGFYSHMHTVLWDDASSSKLKEGMDSFLDQVLHVVGNNAYTPPAAEITNKGNLRASFKAFFATSNSVDLQTSKVMNAPEAVLRRFDLVIIPSLKPEFALDGKLRVPDEEIRSTAQMQYWNFKVYTVGLEGPHARTDKILTKVNGHFAEDGIVHNSCSWSLELETGDLGVLNNFVAARAASCLRVQKKILRDTNKLRDARLTTDGHFEFQAGDPFLVWWSVAYGLLAVFIYEFGGLVLSIVPTSLWIGLLVVLSSVYRFHVMHAAQQLRGFCERVLAALPTVTDFARARLIYRTGMFAERVCSCLRLLRRPRRLVSRWSNRYAIWIAVSGILNVLLMMKVLYAVCVKVQAGDESPAAHWSGPTMSRCDISLTSKSVARPADVLSKIAVNVANFTFGGGMNAKKSDALALTSYANGNLWVTTLHTWLMTGWKDGDKISIKSCGTAIVGDNGGVLSSAITADVGPDRYFACPSQDVVYFFVQGPHMANLTRYVVGDNHKASSMSPCYMLSSNIDPFTGAVGEPRVRTSPTSDYSPHVVTASNAVGALAEHKTFCRFDYPTRGGECGGPYVQTIGNKTAIIGVHEGITTSGMSFCAMISQVQIGLALSHFGCARTGFDDALSQLPPTVELQCGRLSDKSVFLQKRVHGESDISGHLRVIGSLPCSLPPPGTCVRHSPLAERLVSAIPLPRCNKVAPRLGSLSDIYRAKRHFVRAVAAIGNTLDPKMWYQAIDGWIEDARAREYHDDIGEVRVLDTHEAIWGVKTGNLAKYMDPVNMNTSAGHPYSQPKRGLLDGDSFIKPVMDQVERIESRLLAGERPDPADVVFSAAFKDEPITPAKRDACKMRTILGSPLAFLIVFRKYLLPVLAFVQSNRIAYESCPATVAQSSEWALQHDYVTACGTRRHFFDGDYKGWDSSLQKMVVMGFFRMAYSVAERSGNYSPTQLGVIAGLSLVVCESVVNFFGDIIQFSEFQPSGQPATAHTNGGGNSGFFRYVWLSLGLPIDQFRHHVRLLTYGDDNWGSVSDEYASVFNKASLAATLAPHGVVYTNADKSEPVTTFSALEDIDFLKRKWALHEGRVFCPLNLQTLGNMASLYKVSSNQSDMDQIRSTLTSLVHESFFHGRDFFNKVVEEVQAAQRDMGWLVPSYPTFEDKLREFDDASRYFDQNRDRILEAMGH